MARVSTRLSRALGLAALAALVASTLPAHDETSAAGSLGGRVDDEAGSPLPGVTVEAAGPALPSPRVGVTDAAGGYHFSDLPAGWYDVTFRLENFVGVVRKGVVVDQPSLGCVQSAPVSLRKAAIAASRVGKKWAGSIVRVSP